MVALHRSLSSRPFRSLLFADRIARSVTANLLCSGVAMLGHCLYNERVRRVALALSAVRGLNLELHPSHNEVLHRVIAGYQGAYREMFRHASLVHASYQEAAAYDYSRP